MTTFIMDASGESYCCRSELTSSSSSADMLQNHEDANNPADVIHSRGASLASRKRGSKHGDRISVSEETAVSAVATPTTSAALSNDELHHGHGKFKPNTRFYLAFVAISSLTLAAALDATSLSIALPALTKDLGGDAIQSFWTGTAFFLASSIIMPIFAALSHIFGRKTFGAVVFMAGSILGALAPNMNTCIGGRAVQGIGAGIVVVLGEIIVTDLVPLNERGKWLGILGTMWTIGGVIGPLVGGVFAEFVTWRWIFWLNVPFIVVGSVLLQFFLNQTPIAGHWFHKFLRVDWTGAFLFTAGVSAILVPVTIGDVILDWKDWRTTVPMMSGGYLLIAFVIWEMSYAKEPLIPLTIFGNWSVRGMYIQTVLHAIVFWATFYYLPLYYQVVKQYGIFISGIAMLPQTIVVSPTSVIVGILINKYKNFMYFIYAGWFCTTLGAGLLMLLTESTAIPAWIFINAVLCLGLGGLIVAMNFAVQACVEPKECGHAVAFYVFLRQFGEGLGVALGGVIFQNRLRQNLHQYSEFDGRADGWADKATTLGPVVKTLAGIERQHLVSSFVDALKMLWLISCIISAVGLICTLIVKEQTMDRAHETEQGFVMEKRQRSDDGESGDNADNTDDTTLGGNNRDSTTPNTFNEYGVDGTDHVYDRDEWANRRQPDVHPAPIAAAP